MRRGTALTCRCRPLFTRRSEDEEYTVLQALLSPDDPAAAAASPARSLVESYAAAAAAHPAGSEMRARASERAARQLKRWVQMHGK